MFFNRKSKNENNKVVWRDKNGKIACSGNVCVENCNDKCPIHLNTQAIFFMQTGRVEKAIPLYEKALEIAPDFYDAWNNLGGIYGTMHNYQKAYDCYFKARELNKEKPNPVYGLMMVCRDLEKYEECISWCDVYKTLSQDGCDIPVREEVQKKLIKFSESQKTDQKQTTPTDTDNQLEIIKTSDQSDYVLIKRNNRYYLMDNQDGKQELVRTPRGAEFFTNYLLVAEKLFEDIQEYGPECMSSESLLPWHYTMCENFSQMSHSRVESILDSCFLQVPDWTYGCCEYEYWTSLFGSENERVDTIREWLSKCTNMQMTAACCIGNAYHSLNVAFVLAAIMEKYSGENRIQQLSLLAQLIAKHSFYGPDYCIMKEFNNFNLYYGIHLDENGPIIKENLNINLLKNDDVGFAVTEEILIGRNYYHYTSGEKDEKQPLCLNNDLLHHLTAVYDDYSDMELEENEEDEDSGDILSSHIPEDCWVKKLRATEDEGEFYYIIAIRVSEGKAVSVIVLLDSVERLGGGLFFVPGMEMPASHTYEEVNISNCEEAQKELSALKEGRCISNDFSFIGKTLPKEIVESCMLNGNNQQYLITLQSSYRLAYMNLIINTDASGIIKNFDYSTYQSTGSEEGDMFTRPRDINDSNDEALDVLLYILDKYTDEEYKNLNRKNKV